MNTLSNCPVCDKTEFSNFLYPEDYFLSGDSFKIQRCTDCGLKFTNPRPFEKDLGKYYESMDYIPHSNTSKGFIPKAYKMVRNYSLKRKASLISNHADPGKILDIGCGTGELLNLLKDRKWETTGVEPNDSARKYAKKTYGLDVLKETELFGLPGNTFDVVTLWHVLEHVFDLKKTVTQIKKIMKEGGILIVALPNPESLDARIYGKYWAGYNVPRHLYHFAKKDVETLFMDFGFKMIEMKPMVFDSFYVSMLSEKYRYGKQNYLRAMYNGFISNISGATNKNNYSSIIYILKSNIT